MKYLYDMQGVTGRWQVLLSLLGKMILEFEFFFLGGGGEIISKWQFLAWKYIRISFRRMSVSVVLGIIT